MSTTPSVLFRGAASTGSTTLYTVPASTTTIITDILVTNTAATTATFTLNFDGVAVFSAAFIPANSTASFNIKQVLTTTKVIAGSASATTINFSISGVQLT